MTAAQSLTTTQATSPSDPTQGLLSGSVLSAAIRSATAETVQALYATAGQTSFTLSRAPTVPTTFVLTVNGIDATNAATLSGVNVTWGGAYPLGPEDTILASFT